MLFEGIHDNQGETELECIRKLRAVLNWIPDLDAQNFKIEHCHRLDGQFRANSTRRVICCFNWYSDIQQILRNRKCLPKGVYVNEDLPEEWSDRCRILKPIFNAAKKTEKLKSKTFFSKDKLVIDGKMYSHFNAIEANAVLDLPATCQRSSEDLTKLVFLGAHSVFSNMHHAAFKIDNVSYSSAEQFIQSQKVTLFDDDVSHSRIMKESNPFKMKKIGSKIRNYAEPKWIQHRQQVALAAV